MVAGASGGPDHRDRAAREPARASYRRGPVALARDVPAEIGQRVDCRGFRLGLKRSMESPQTCEAWSPRMRGLWGQANPRDEAG